MNLAGQSLRDLTLPKKTVMILVRRDGDVIHSRRETSLQAGDKLTLMGRLEGVRELARRCYSSCGQIAFPLSTGREKSSMREKRSRNRRILFLALAVLVVLSLMLGECCLLVGLVQREIAHQNEKPHRDELFTMVQVALAQRGAPDRACPALSGDGFAA